MKIAFVSLNTYKPTNAPLGLVYLSTIIKQKYPSEELRIIDANFEDVEEELKNYSPDIIGITAMTTDYGRAIKLAKKIKNIPILIGGVHITTLPNSFKDSFKIGILGEGEYILLDLIKIYKKYNKFPKEELKKITGLLFLENGELINTGRRELIKNLDEIPHPDRSLINKGYFKKEILEDGSVGIRHNMIASRGCPFECVFCSTSKFWAKKIRYHSVDYIVEEVRILHKKYGVNYINVPDDLFLTNNKKARELVGALKKEGLEKIKWGVQLKAELINEDLLSTLKELNVVRIGCGFESGSQKVLNYLKKGTVNLEKSKEAVRLMIKHKFLVGGSFMFAVPGETIEDMYKTLDLIKEFKKIGAKDLSTFVLTPYPGTEIWEIAKQKGKVSDDMDWDFLRQNSEDQALNPILLDDDIDMKEYHKFYKKRGELMKSFKIDIIKRDLKKRPFWVLKRAITKPKTTFNIIFKKILYG